MNSGYMTSEPMTERTLHDLLFPFMARLHVELTDEFEDLEIHKFDPRVLSEIKKLIGRDLHSLHDASLEAQEMAIRKSREAVRALYRADEVVGLDKRPALDYTYGWVIAVETFLPELTTCVSSISPTGCGKDLCPSSDRIEAAANRAANVFGCNQPEFIRGFKDCVAEKIGATSSGCQLKAKQF